MGSTKIGGLSKDSWECSGIAQPFCNPQDCRRLRQIWELTQNPDALCQDCKKMVQSTIPAEHSAKWLRIAVEFRNGPAIHTIFMQCFQLTCNPFKNCNPDAIQVYGLSVDWSDWSQITLFPQLAHLRRIPLDCPWIAPVCTIQVQSGLVNWGLIGLVLSNFLRGKCGNFGSSPN